jgi:hypothetical protein
MTGLEGNARGGSVVPSTRLLPLRQPSHVLAIFRSRTPFSRLPRTVYQTLRRGRAILEWFSRKTSVAGTEIPNWALVLAAVIVIWIIYRLFA